jgi:hypothetical protein
MPLSLLKELIMNVSVLHMKVSEFNLQAQNTETCTTESEWYKHISKDVQWFRGTKKSE